MLGHAAEMVNDAAGHEPEIAGVERKASVGHAGHQTIEKIEAQFQKDAFFAASALSVDDVVAFLKFRDESGNGFGRILEIAVEYHGDVAGNVIEGGGEGGLMAEISRENDDRYARIVFRGFFQHLASGVRAAIVHKDHFVRAAGHGVERGSDTAQEFRENHLLVVERNDDRDGRRGHGFLRPLK